MIELKVGKEYILKDGTKVICTRESAVVKGMYWLFGIYPEFCKDPCERPYLKNGKYHGILHPAKTYHDVLLQRK